jgi:hypothetical protein
MRSKPIEENELSHKEKEIKMGRKFSILAR